jgi:hypothetical protein
MRAIRKLLALGLRETDVYELLRDGVEPHHQFVEIPPDLHDSDKQERVRLGQWAIRTLLAFGFSESEIAARIDVDPTTIAHVLEPVEPRVLSLDTLSRLKHALQTAGAERLKLLLPRIPITVLDTCNDTCRAVDEATREQLALQMRTDLQNALIFASAPEPLMTGIHAFLSRIGDPCHGLYMMKVPFVAEDTPEQAGRHLRLLEHEIQHILNRVREVRQRLEKSKRQKRHVPADGRIA